VLGERLAEEHEGSRLSMKKPVVVGAVGVETMGIPTTLGS
jgi:hypothetical protein